MVLTANKKFHLKDVERKPTVRITQFNPKIYNSLLSMKILNYFVDYKRINLTTKHKKEINSLHGYAMRFNNLKDSFHFTFFKVITTVLLL